MATRSDGSAGTNAGPLPAHVLSPCPSPSSDIDADLCTVPVPPSRGWTPDDPVEWGVPQHGAPWHGRLECPNGAEPRWTRTGPAGPVRTPSVAPPSGLPRSADVDELDVWLVACPGDATARRLHLNPFRCGDPCPPRGWRLLSARAAAAVVASQSQTEPAAALEWGRRAVQWAPSSARALQAWAAAAMAAREPAEARVAFEQLLRVDPRSAIVRLDGAFATLAATAAGRDAPRSAIVPRDVHVVEPAPSPAAALRYVRLTDADVAALDALGARRGSAAIDTDDLRAPVPALPGIDQDGGWLGRTLRRPEQWEQLRLVARSGERRDHTWLAVALDGDGALADVQRFRHPEGFARLLLRDPLAALVAIERDLRSHVAGLDPSWTLERVRGELCAAQFVGAARALFEAQREGEDLTIDQTAVLARDRIAPLYFETVNVVRMVRLLGDADPVVRLHAWRFLDRLHSHAEAVLPWFDAARSAAPFGSTDAANAEDAAHDAPAAFAALAVLRAVADVTRRALAEVGSATHAAHADVGP